MSARTIDVSDYVEAAEGVQTLAFGDSRQQARFELGVAMCVYKWDALEVAVQNNWGGPDSADKRDWMTGIVVELFQDRVVDLQSIEELLLNAMEDEFDVNVEDDSVLPVAALILQVYRECAMGQYTTVEDLYARWQEKQAKRASEREKYQVNVAEDPMNPSDDDDEEEDDDVDASHVTDHVPQLVDSEMADAAPAGPIIDEDGFELVQSKHRGRRSGR